MDHRPAPELSPSDLLKASKAIGSVKLQSPQDLYEEEEHATSATAAAAPSNPKLLRAKRMKSLYVAVSKRGTRLTDTEVTPFGKVKKVKKRADSDLELEMYRMSTLSAEECNTQDSATLNEAPSQEEADGDQDAEYQYYRDSRESLEGRDHGEEDGEDDPIGRGLRQARAEAHSDEEGDEGEQGQLVTSTVSWGGRSTTARPASTSRNSAGRTSPTPLEDFVPVPARRRTFSKGSILSAYDDTDDDEEGQEDADGGRRRARDREDTSETVSNASAQRSVASNALERSAERRRSRSASPSAIAAIRRANKREGRSRSGSAAGVLGQTATGGNFLDMFSPAKYVEEAGVLSAYDVLMSNSRQPLVRRLFDNYCKSDQTLDIPLVQQLCYDMSIYYSHMDIRIAIKPFIGSGQSSMNYDSFMVWWRSNSDFRYSLQI